MYPRRGPVSMVRQEGGRRGHIRPFRQGHALHGSSATKNLALDLLRPRAVAIRGKGNPLGFLGLDLARRSGIAIADVASLGEISVGLQGTGADGILCRSVPRGQRSATGRPTAGISLQKGIVPPWFSFQIDT